MEVTSITAFNLSDAWYQCLSQIMQNSGVREYEITRGSYKGKFRREFDSIAIQIINPSATPLIPDIPPNLNLTPPTTLEYVYDYFQNYLLNPDIKENESYTYGNRIYYQVLEVIEIFINEGHGTNQATIEVATPSDITLEEPPCLRIIDCKIQDGKLHFIIYFRSWDLWGGMPANLAGLQLLKQYMSEMIGVEDGQIIAYSKGLHLYDYAWDFAKTRVYK